MEIIIIMASIVFAAFWTIGSIKFFRRGGTYSLSFITSMGLWTLIIYFYQEEELSRFHMLWAMPLVFAFTNYCIIFIRCSILYVQRRGNQ
jgi:hypothetical protein